MSKLKKMKQEGAAPDTAAMKSMLSCVDGTLVINGRKKLSGHIIIPADVKIIPSSAFSAVPA